MLVEFAVSAEAFGSAATIVLSMPGS